MHAKWNETMVLTRKRNKKEKKNCVCRYELNCKKWESLCMLNRYSVHEKKKKKTDGRKISNVTITISEYWTLMGVIWCVSLSIFPQVKSSRAPAKTFRCWFFFYSFAIERLEQKNKISNSVCAHIPILSWWMFHLCVHHTGNMKYVSAGFYLVISLLFFISVFRYVICFEK